MNWKFWKKTGTDSLPKPKELTSDLGKYLVVNLQYDPDWIWQLKMVIDLPKTGLPILGYMTLPLWPCRGRSSKITRLWTGSMVLFCLTAGFANRLGSLR